MNGGEAFSNGSEFEIWEASHCAICERDRAFRARGFDGDDGCEILLRGLMSRDVPEWTTDLGLDARHIWPNIICAKFERVSADERAKGEA